MTSPRELMRLHVEALFTHDPDGDLVVGNEPGGPPSPRFFLGKTTDGALWRFRHDLGEQPRRELDAVCKGEAGEKRLAESAAEPARYADILARFAPVQRTWEGPAFSFPRELPPAPGTVLVHEGNAEILRPFLEAWIPDVRLSQPMFAVTVDGVAVAVCCSVRQTDAAYEAGVETSLPYRGRGFATRVVATWGDAVRGMGRVPLYSTSWQNEASRALARKLGLVHFGNDLHIT